MDKIELIGIDKTSGQIEEIILTSAELKAQLKAGELKAGDTVWVEAKIDTIWNAHYLQLEGQFGHKLHIDKRYIVAHFPKEKPEPEKAELLRKINAKDYSDALRTLKDLLFAHG